MQKIYNSITELVGHTPLLRLGNLATKTAAQRRNTGEVRDV